MQIINATKGKSHNHRNPRKIRKINCGHFDGFEMMGKKKSFKRLINNEFSFSIPGPI